MRLYVIAYTGNEIVGGATSYAWSRVLPDPPFD
jgi:hypothetical protein